MPDSVEEEPAEVERYELRERAAYRFAADRREFVQALGAGLVVAVSAASRPRNAGAGGAAADGAAAMAARSPLRGGSTSIKTAWSPPSPARWK